MLDARSANLMDLAAALPLEADWTDMRYQWIARFRANPLVDTADVMAPFARQVLERQAGGGEPLALILDQSKIDLAPPDRTRYRVQRQALYAISI
jgi:hypothetical protein